MAQEKYLGENGLKRLVGLVKEDLGTKANIDGSYDGMQVGSAKQIVSPTGITDTTPYIFRTTCGETSISGGDEQLASLKAIRGNTIVWNQLIKETNKTQSFETTQTGAIAIQTGLSIPKNHKILIIYDQTETLTSNTRNALYVTDGGNNVVQSSSSNYNLPKGRYGWLYTVENEVTSLGFWAHTPSKNYSITNIQLFDLFGIENEPTSVLEFTRLFPKTYYPFNQGEIRNAKTTGLKTVGYNAWDEEYRIGLIQYDKNQTNFGQDISGSNVCSKNYIKVIPGQTYSVEPTSSQQSGIVFCYDANKNPIIVGDSGYITATGNSITLPDNCCYVKFYMAQPYGSVYKNDVAFHLTWSGSRTGFEPHEEHILRIDTSRYFPDGMNGFGGVYDELTPKHAIQRFAKVDLGTLEWSYNSAVAGQERFTSHTLRNFISKISYMNIKCAKYETVEAGDVINHAKDKIIANNDGYIQVYDSSYTDATAFKQAMSGVYLIYELADPVVTDIPQVRDNHWEIKVDDYGTEEWLFNQGDEIPVPVGHETLYMDNLVDKLRNLPDPSDYKALESELQTWVKLPPLPTDTTKVYVPKFVNGTIKWVEE